MIVFLFQFRLIMIQWWQWLFGSVLDVILLCSWILTSHLRYALYVKPWWLKSKLSLFFEFSWDLQFLILFTISLFWKQKSIKSWDSFCFWKYSELQLKVILVVHSHPQLRLWHFQEVQVNSWFQGALEMQCFQWLQLL